MIEITKHTEKNNRGIRLNLSQRLRIPLTFAAFLAAAFGFLSSYQNVLNVFPSVNNEEVERIMFFF